MYFRTLQFCSRFHVYGNRTINQSIIDYQQKNNNNLIIFIYLVKSVCFCYLTYIEAIKSRYLKEFFFCITFFLSFDL